MRTSSRRAGSLLVGAIGVTAVLLLPSAAQAADVTNGSFEDGTTGWTIEDWPESNGTWSAVEATVGPLSENEIPAATCGDYQAVFDQNEESSSVIYQDLVVDADSTSTLTFTHWYQNANIEEQEGLELQGLPSSEFVPSAPGDAIWATPDNLDPGGDEANQQYRIDVVDPAADPFSLAPDDVLLNVFRTVDGDPASIAPTEISVDLTTFAGQTVRLRFAGVAGEYYLNAGVDCVELAAVASTTTTTAPSTTTTTAAAAAAQAVAPRYAG